MKLGNTIICIVLLFFSWNIAKSQVDTNVIRCVKAINFFPLLSYDGKLAQYDTSYAYIYSYGNQLMYYMSRTHFILGRTKEDTPVKKEFYHRLVFTKGQAYGNYYNDWKIIYNKKVPVDSILKEEWVGTSKVDMDTTKANYTLASSGYIPNTDTLLEIYKWVAKLDTNMYGSTTLYYTPFKPGLPHSVDSVMEKKKGMTLCKVIIFTHVGYTAKGVFRTLEFNWQNETQEIPVTNRDELLVFFRHNQKGEYFPQVADVGW